MVFRPSPECVSVQLNFGGSKTAARPQHSLTAPRAEAYLKSEGDAGLACRLKPLSFHLSGPLIQKGGNRLR
jgi:hypothetical protein